jgi:hypothetical protein
MILHLFIYFIYLFYLFILFIYLISLCIYYCSIFLNDLFVLNDRADECWQSPGLSHEGDGRAAQGSERAGFVPEARRQCQKPALAFEQESE